MFTVTNLNDSGAGSLRWAVERPGRRVVRFEPGQRLELPVVLGPGCEPLACAPRLSCGNDGACRSPDVSACEYVGRSCDEDPVVLPDAGP